ncbi:hypothetical protein B6U96_15995 [Archaeoglobales archaeon ex4484_92]|nr:MAG: hypothetical protein B6U96_15995 [Archaeoglobales archaeon ex4484_92]
MEFLEILDDVMSSLPRRSMIEIYEDKFTIVGDLHADYEALGVIKKNILGKAIFLGDYADRGDDPIDVYKEVFNLFLDDKAIILRGNHESQEVFPHDLPFQLKETFGEEGVEIYEGLKRLWEKMPISALANGELWLVHGGVPTKGCKVKHEGITRKEIEKPSNELKMEMMWNDPWDNPDCGLNWQRGFMYFFGKIATRTLLNTLDVKVVVRSHEPYKILKVEQDGMVVTIGSCANPYGLPHFAILQVDTRIGFKDGFELIRNFGKVLKL